MPEAIEFQLYNKLNTTLVAALPGAKARRWLDPENDAGSGEMELHADDPVATGTLTDANGDAVYGNVVRCNLNGTTRFAWIIEENTKSTAKAGEEVERVLKLAGKGLLGYFQHAVLYPERGIGRISPDTRLFNWTSADFDDSSWVAAEQVKQQSAIVTLNSWNGLPKDWPDPTAYWIWGAAGEQAADVPDGDVYFRKFFTMTDTSPCVIAFTADDGVDLYLDNARLASKVVDKGHSWPVAARTDLFLDAGSHLLAAKASNVPTADLDDPSVINIAGLLVAVHHNTFGQTAPNNTDFGTVVTHTDSSWVCLQYPPGGPPGMTPGEVMRIMFEEAQARGAIPGVTWSFTDANDSNGNPWAVVPDLGFEVGISYYAALRQIAEVACDLHMDPTSLRLDAYNQRGSASAAVLSIGTNITDLEHQGTGDLTNSVLLRFSDGWREVISAASIATGGRQESFLSTGVAPSEEQATLAAQAIFAEQANPRDAFIVTHEGRPGSGTEPYAAYNVGDRISVPARDATANTEVVKAITVSEDEEGNPIFTPELRSLSSELAERLQRWVKKMSAGTVAGTSENASPFRPGGGVAEKVAPAAVPPTGAGFRYATVVVAASDSLNPSDADFVCTGAADQTTFAAAVAALPNSGDSFNASGGRVLLMEGTYVITGSTAVTGARHVTIQGQGLSTIIDVQADFSGSRIFNLTMDGQGCVRDLFIRGNDHLVSRAIHVDGSPTIDTGLIENVVVDDLRCTVAVFSAICQEEWASIRGCQARNTTGTSFRVDDNAVLIDCASFPITGMGLDGTAAGYVFATGCRFNGDTAPAVRMVTGQLYMTDCDAVSDQVALELQTATGAGVIAGCRIRSTGATSHVVKMDGTENLITSCFISGSATGSNDLVNVTGDTNQVLGNYLKGNASVTTRTGVRVEATADKTAVVGNSIRSCAAGINDLGTNTQIDYTGGGAGDNVVY